MQQEKLNPQQPQATSKTSSALFFSPNGLNNWRVFVSLRGKTSLEIFIPGLKPKISYPSTVKRWQTKSISIASDLTFEVSQKVFPCRILNFVKVNSSLILLNICYFVDSFISINKRQINYQHSKTSWLMAIFTLKAWSIRISCPPQHRYTLSPICS